MCSWTSVITLNPNCIKALKFRDISGSSPSAMLRSLQRRLMWTNVWLEPTCAYDKRYYCWCTLQHLVEMVCAIVVLFLTSTSSYWERVLRRQEERTNATLLPTRRFGWVHACFQKHVIHTPCPGITVPSLTTTGITKCWVILRADMAICLH